MKRVLLFLSVLLLAIYACDEEVSEPCGEDIKLTIVTEYEDCDGEARIAKGAEIIIYQNNDDGTRSRLDSGVADGEGKYVFAPAESGCGLNSLNIFANYGDRSASEAVSYVCSDSSVYISINLCVPDTSVVTSCDDLDLTSNLVFIDDNSGEECIAVGAPGGNLYYKRTAYYTNGTTCNIRINGVGALNGAPNFNINKFRLTGASPAPVGGAVVLAPGGTLQLDFEVNSDQIGSYNYQINLEVECEGESCVGSGVWTINLGAEVCETPCVCPFSEELIEIERDEMFTAGETKDFASQLIFKIGKSAIEEDCYFEITSIVRIDENRNLYSPSFNPYTNINPEDNWTVTTVAGKINGKQLKAGDELRLDFQAIAPNEKGAFADTFRVNGAIYNKNGELVDDDCAKDLYIWARACENPCEELIVRFNTGNTADPDKDTKPFVREVNVQGLTNIWDETLWVAPSHEPRVVQNGDRISMQAKHNYNELFVNFNAEAGSPTDCLDDSNPYELNFSVALPSGYKRDEICQLPRTVSISTSPTGESDNAIDAGYFSVKTGRFEIEDVNDLINIAVEFNPPTIDELESLWTSGKKPDQDTTFKIRLSVYDEDFDCHIMLNFQASVSRIPKPGPIRQLYAYSQVTSKQTNPDYMAVEINAWHQDGYWGVDKNQVDPRAGTFPISGDSFFINVENPSGPVGQPPLLNLVPRGAVFDRISDGAVATFNTDNGFITGYGGVINGLFDDQGCFVEPTPNKAASTFTGINGLPISAGDVFVAWSSKYSYGSCPNPCHVALIYIYEVSDGTDAANVSDVANIRYRIVYPIFR